MMINHYLEGLINCAQWHALQKKHATVQIVAKKIKPPIFSQNILEFLASYFKPTDAIHLAVACGDEARFLDVLQLIQYASQKSWMLDVYILPTLAEQWKKFIQNEEMVFPIFFTYDIPLEKAYFCIFDIIAPLEVSSLGKDHQLMIAAVEMHPSIKIALDMPSGLNPDTGAMRSSNVVHADITLCRFAYFQGLYTGVAQAYSQSSAILTPEWPLVLDFHYYLLTREYLTSIWPARLAYASKASFKRVKVIAGQKSMFGASILAGYAALVMGAGWVEVLYQEGLIPPYGQIPEIIWQPIVKAEEILNHIQADDILVVGPGLGSEQWGDTLWSLVKNLPNTMVVDAGALKYLAKDVLKRENWVITPHPGEAANLLGWTVEQVQSDRFQAIHSLQDKFQATCVLKGAGSLVTQDAQHVILSADGNPGMATPGMGDVLSGLIAGCLAQIDDLGQATLLAVGLHAWAGDRVMKRHPAMIVRPMKLIQELQNHMQDVLCK